MSEVKILRDVNEELKKDYREVSTSSQVTTRQCCEVTTVVLCVQYWSEARYLHMQTCFMHNLHAFFQRFLHVPPHFTHITFLRHVFCSHVSTSTCMYTCFTHIYFMFPLNLLHVSHPFSYSFTCIHLLCSLCMLYAYV